jgi:hypothetical protein
MIANISSKGTNVWHVKKCLLSGGPAEPGTNNKCHIWKYTQSWVCHPSVLISFTCVRPSVRSFGQQNKPMVFTKQNYHVTTPTQEIQTKMSKSTNTICQYSLSVVSGTVFYPTGWLGLSCPALNLCSLLILFAAGLPNGTLHCSNLRRPRNNNTMILERFWYCKIAYVCILLYKIRQ